MAEFLVPVHTEDLELERADRYYVVRVLDLDVPGVDADALIEGVRPADVCASHPDADAAHELPTS